MTYESNLQKGGMTHMLRVYICLGYTVVLTLGMVGALYGS